MYGWGLMKHHTSGSGADVPELSGRTDAIRAALSVGWSVMREDVTPALPLLTSRRRHTFTKYYVLLCP